MKSSRDCSIHHNTVQVASYMGSSVGQGIGVMDHNRDDGGTSCATVLCRGVNNSILLNQVSYSGPPVDGGPGHSGIVTDYDNAVFWVTHGNMFDCNVYLYSPTSDSRFAYADVWPTFAGFVSFGMEPNGALNSALPDPHACDEELLSAIETRTSKLGGHHAGSRRSINRGKRSVEGKSPSIKTNYLED